MWLGEDYSLLGGTNATCGGAPPTSDDRGEVSESAGVVKPRVHLAVRLPRPHMTHDDERRVRQEH